MTYILLTLFVFSIGKIIHSFFEFFEWDYERYYDLSPLWFKFILKPTIYCNVCMSSFWGSVCYWGLLNGRSWQEWILHCVICAGVIWIGNKLLER